jgi:hypothetical protein
MNTMSTNTDPQQLDGFERRLLGALLTVDDARRAASHLSPAPRRGPILRRTIAVVTGVLAAGGLTAAAVAVLIDPASFQPAGEVVVRGQDLLLKGSGCGSGEAVSFGLDGHAVGSGTAANNGTFVVSVWIPSSTTLGSHQLSASCSSPDGTTLTQDATIEVLAVAEPLGPSLSMGGAVPAGNSTTAKGSGCAGSTDVHLAIEGVEVGANVMAGSEGSFFVDVEVPTSTTPGTYRVTATCVGSNGEPLEQTTDLTVLPAGSEAPATDKAEPTSE